MRRRTGGIAAVAALALLLFAIFAWWPRSPEPLPVAPGDGAEADATAERPTPPPADAAAAEAPAAPAPPAPREPDFRGRVVTPEREPVAGAEIRVESPDGKSWRSGLRSAKDGTFKVDRVSTDTVLAVDHPAFLPYRAPFADLATGTDVVLDPGLAVSGRVTFPDGSPVPGIRIEGGGRSCRAGEDGRYRLSGLPEGPVDVSCRDPNRHGPTRAACAGETACDFVLEEHALRVRAQNERGEPLDPAMCSVHFRGGGTGAGIRPGEPLVLLVPGGVTCRISASADGRRRAVETVRIDGPPSLHDVVVVLPPADERGSLSLRIAAEDGEPVPTVRVTLADDGGGWVQGFIGREVVLDRDGAVTLTEVPAGTFRLTLRAGEYGLPAEQPVVIRSGETTTARALLHYGGQVRLRVRNAAGETVSGGQLDLLDVDDPGSEWRRAFRTSKGGFSVLSRIARPGTYRVRSTVDGRGVLSDPFPVHAGETTEVELRRPE